MTQQHLTTSDNQPLALHQDVDPILVMIQSAARDPEADVEKMERLMAMYERQQDKHAEAAFNKAMNSAQRSITRVAADASNKQTSSKYASYAALDRALRPVYTECGFSLSFDETESPKPDHIRVLCYVSHEAGHTRTYHKDMPADGKGAKGGDVMTKTHAAGAASSYGMRYLLKGIFNVAIGEDDTDGNVPEAELIDESTQADINALIDEILTKPEQRVAFSGWLKTELKVQNGFVRNIPQKKAELVVEMLNKKKAAS